MNTIHRILVLGVSSTALAACGADEIVSPGTSGDIIINNPAPTPAPTPTPTPTGGTGVTPAAGCPTIATAAGLTDSGTITGPTGTYRVCQLPGTFTADDRLPQIDGLLYQIAGRVNVGTDQGFDSTGTDVTLTIEPGVILFAQAESFFVVNRGNEIAADGTEDNPIIWTSRDNVLGLATDSSDAQWGGVVLLGRARVADCQDLVFNTTPGNFTANDQCEQQLEGTVTATPFGGADDSDSSGSFTFNQIRFSGFELQQANELQSLTTGGVGSGTTISNVFSFNSSDDGLEFFGGTFDASNLAIVGASDDSLDVDSGARVDLQNVIIVQRTNTGDSLIELDSPGGEQPTPVNAQPQTVLQVNNFTFVQRSAASSQIIRARGGAALGLTNGILDADDAGGGLCFRIDESETQAAIIGLNSIVGDCDAARPVRGSANDDATDAALFDLFDDNSDLDFTLSLTDTFVSGANEDAVEAFDGADLTARSSFFTDTGFIGAVADDLADDFGDWTCNSSIIDFGSANGSCTSLPT
ncbi:hypothetical protein [Erythrobacter sp.]|uniref:hypothetical protein n=1 Tax=Erythrobacter sp. TaxID=1042 RepID=UPI002EC69948|nr:hypothetical protein [Erythrobacter sp.]